jgi:hypothetical protein
VRPGRLVLALVLLVAAVAAGLLAADLRSWNDAVRAGDEQYARDPGGAVWSAATALPFDPALRILDLSNQLAFRRAATAFTQVEAAGNGVDNGYRESLARGSLETVLTGIANGSNRRVDSDAENLLGILAFADSQQLGPNTPAPVERSVAAFQAAVQLDPTNEAAKYNLELLLHTLVAKGVRTGSSSTSGGPSKGHRGAGGGLPGRGY